MISRSVWLKADETRLTLSRAHTPAKAASVTKLLPYTNVQVTHPSMQSMAVMTPPNHNSKYPNPIVTNDHQNLIISSVAHVPTYNQITWKSSEECLRNPTNKQTNLDENVTSLAEVIENNML